MESTLTTPAIAEIVERHVNADGLKSLNQNEKVLVTPEQIQKVKDPRRIGGSEEHVNDGGELHAWDFREAVTKRFLSFLQSISRN